MDAGGAELCPAASPQEVFCPWTRLTGSKAGAKHLDHKTGPVSFFRVGEQAV